MTHEPVDPSDFNEGGTYDGHTLLDLSELPVVPELVNDDWPRARPFQEDGHLAVDAWIREHPDEV